MHQGLSCEVVMLKEKEMVGGSCQAGSGRVSSRDGFQESSRALGREVAFAP